MTKTLIATLGAALLAGFASAQFTIDGTKDAAYPSTVTFQTAPTQFGDSNTGSIGNANGSELDGVFAQFTPGFLNIIFTGNLETNFNHLNLFFDVDGTANGQNRLLGGSGSGSLDRLGDDGTGNGLTFDAGFAPDYFLDINGGSDGTFFVDYAEIPTTGAGVSAFIGQTAPGGGGNGVLTGGTNPMGLLAAVNNSNVGGVSGTAVNDPSSVTTGVEFAIPLAMIGNVNYGTGVRISALINGAGNGFYSNQTLGGLPDGTANLGEPRNVNLNNFAGNQFFAVPEPASMAAIGFGLLGLISRRRKKSA